MDLDTARALADDLTRSSDDLTDHEREALEHARLRVAEDGAHSLSGCPRFCRAMCSYGRTLNRLIARGVEVPS